jgi:proline dehydrogenase
MKLLYPLAKRFIAGHDFESAIPVISKLIWDGYDITIDYLGELSKTKEDCQNAQQQYVDIIEYYGAIKAPIDISIKPTQLGLLLDKVDCEVRLIDLAGKAYEHGLTIRLDMEDSNVTQDTIDLCLRLHKEYSNVGTPSFIM